MDEFSERGRRWAVVIDDERDALRAIVKAARRFAVVFLRYAPSWSGRGLDNEVARNVREIARRRRRTERDRTVQTERDDVPPPAAN
jgi:hypothetical protein